MTIPLTKARRHVTIPVIGSPVWSVPAAGITTSDYWGRRQAKGDHMDATKLLIADHNRVKGLFARFKKASESEDVTAAGLLVSQIMED